MSPLCSDEENTILGLNKGMLYDNNQQAYMLVQH